MRDYQPHKSNPYWLPKTLYRRVLVTVRDYDRMVEEYREIAHETASSDGGARSSRPGDPVERKVERMDRLWQDIRAIEMALIRVPAEYRQGVLEKVMTDHWPANIPVGKNGPGRWKSKFLYWVAKNENLI